MRRTTQIRLLGILGTLLIGLAISSTARAQATDSAATSQTIQAACGRTIEECGQRLDKALDAYEKAIKALTFATDEITARKQLDALKDQVIAVKDLIIANQDELIKRLQGNKNSVWSRVKKILEILEKAALIGVGVAVGRGL